MTGIDPSAVGVISGLGVMLSAYLAYRTKSTDQKTTSNKDAFAQMQTLYNNVYQELTIMRAQNQEISSKLDVALKQNLELQVALDSANNKIEGLERRLQSYEKNTNV